MVLRNSFSSLSEIGFVWNSIFCVLRQRSLTFVGFSFLSGIITFSPDDAVISSEVWDNTDFI